MNIIQPNTTGTQSMTITPRLMVAADAYRIVFLKEGTSTELSVIASYIALQGGRLSLLFSLNAVFNNFYWFKVYATVGSSEIEIYRGKAFATDETEPLKYSIYKPFTSLSPRFDSTLYTFDSIILTFDNG